MLPRQTLYGRRTEREILDGLLGNIHAGSRAVLVLRGEPGEGKTTLLDHLGDKANGSRVIRIAGVQSEMELAYAGLHQFCMSMLDGIESLPTPQRDALAVAFGLREGAPPERFLVALAVLTLLTKTADKQPLVCLIDDVQWLDRASVQALAFVARRLAADPIAMVFAQVDAGDDELSGLPELVITGLDDSDSRSLLASAAPHLLDEQVRDRVLAEARGNPLALLELPAEFSSGQPAGWFEPPRAGPREGRSALIEEAYLRRARGLPMATQRFLILAAVEPVGDPTVLWRAAFASGLDKDVAEPAAAAGLITLGTQVRFAHPLVRSAVYRAAGRLELQQAHRTLAEVTDPRTDPDRRVWHLAAAAAAPHESLASELEGSANRARARGGAASAAAFLRRATELTPEPVQRGRRALAAAEAALAAGLPDAVDELLATARMARLDGMQLARAERLDAELMFKRGRGADASVPLLDAARRLTPLDVPLARKTYLEALLAAVFTGTGSPELEQRLHTVAEAARSAPANPGSGDPVDLLLDGLSAQVVLGYAPAVPTLRRALDAADTADADTWISLTFSLVAAELWEGPAWLDLLGRHVRESRDHGALSLLPVTLDHLASLYLQAGDFVTAGVMNEQAATLNAATQLVPQPNTPMMLAAWRGDEPGTVRLTEVGVQGTFPRGEGNALVSADYAVAVLDNARGRYPTALAAAERATAGDQLVGTSWALPELVEAAARLQEWDIGEAALRELTVRTQASGTPWALGTEARARALLNRGPDAEDLYRTAIELLAECRMNAHLARGHLVYGEWLRRDNRRAEARDQLRLANDLFTRMGAQAFGERARNELLATGETVRKRTPDTRLDLTPQESLIASLARDGRTNQEIGAELFISPRTVEWHLRKVFAKLAIGSRRELRNAPLKEMNP